MALVTFDPLATPSDENLIWKAVNVVLSEERTGLAVGLQIFASCLAVLAALKLGYWIITTIGKAAREGTTLKGTYNEIWGPLAVVFGFGMLIPVPNTGMPVAIYVLRHIVAKPGVNLFDAIAVGTAEHLIKDGRPILPMAIWGKEFAWSVVQSEVCSYVLTQAGNRYSGYGVFGTIPPKPPASVGQIVKNQDGTEKITWDWGSQCGSISLAYPSKEDFGEFGAARNAAAMKLIDEVRNLKVHEGLVERLKPVGVEEAHIEGYVDESNVERYQKAGFLVFDLTEKLNAIGAAYEKTVADEASRSGTAGQTEQRKKLVDGVKTYGGAVLFSYFRVLSQLNEKANAYASEKPYYIAPNELAWGGGTAKPEVQFALRLLNNQRTLESKSIKLNGDDLDFIGQQENNLFADAVNYVSHPIVDYLTSYDGWRPDPVADLMNVGGRMMTGAKLGFAAGLAATGASNFWSSTAGKIVEFSMTPVWPLLGLMYVGGAMLQIVLPLMPMINGIFGIAAFTLWLIVAAIAVLIWAFMHARLDHGDGFVSTHSAPGYKIMFTIFLMLPINMLAFIAGMQATVVVLNIFLFVWSFGFRGGMGGDIIGFASILAAFGVSMYIQWKIVSMIFSMNSNLYEKVALWFGHSVQGMGDAAQSNTLIAGIYGNAGAANPSKPQGKGAPKQEPKSNNNTQPQGGGQRNLSTPAAEKTNSKDEI
ncbi:DotA/TraY family protein [Brucella sp. C7-11G]